jgi:hypothetical protein
MLVAENILPLPGALAHPEHALEDFQEAWAARGRLRGRRGNHARVGRRSCNKWRSNLGDMRSCGVLWLDIQYLHILDKGNPGDLLNHEHNLWCISTTTKMTHDNVEDLTQNVVEDVEWLPLKVVLDEVPLILRASCGIPNPRSKCHLEEVVKSVQLR